MRASSINKLVIAIAMLGPASTARAQQIEKARTDLYGDPLPEGAIARCGTMRLRHPYFHIGIASAFTPDGKELATHDGMTLRFWDVATGKLLREFKGEWGSRRLHFSRDGKLLAVQKDGEEVRVLDPLTGKELLQFKTKDEVLTISPDGKLLVLAGKEGALRLLKTATGEQIKRFVARKEFVYSGRFSTDGATLATTDGSKEVCRWDTATGERLMRLDVPSSKTQAIHLSPDGSLFAVSRNGQEPVTLWDAVTGKEKVKLQGTMNWAENDLAFTPDCRTLATICKGDKADEMAISLWDVETGKLRRRFFVPESTAYYIQITPDGRTALTKHYGSPVIYLWDIATGRRRINHPAHDQRVDVLAITRDGRKVVSGGSDGTIRVWDAATGKQERALDSHRWGVPCLALSPDDQTVLSGGYDGTVRLHELATGKERWRFDVGPPPEEQQRFQFLVRYLGIAPDGRSALTFTLMGNNDALMHKLDLATGKAVLRRALGYTEFRSGSFSPDCRFIVGFRTRIFGPNESPSDPKILEQIRGNGGFTLCEAATGREVAALRLPDFPGAYHRFTPDGRMIVNVTWQRSASDGYRRDTKMAVHVWELASGKERLAMDQPVEGDGFNLAGLAVSADGSTLAATRSDGILQLWDMASGKELLRRKAYGWSRALAFTPDGKRLASGHNDGTILIWDLSPEIDRRSSPPKADAKKVEQWWTALAGDDAKAAHVSIWGLAAAPEQTLPLLRDRLRPAITPPAEKLKQLLSDLDSEEFAKRTAIFKELADLEELAEPALRDALKEDISAEKRKSLEKLLNISLIVRTPEKLRHLRAIEVLEHIGSPEARKVLETMAKGAPEARLTGEAKAALERLGRRRAP